jgi:hypothetical protein
MVSALLKARLGLQDLLNLRRFEFRHFLNLPALALPFSKVMLGVAARIRIRTRKIPQIRRDNDKIGR